MNVIGFIGSPRKKGNTELLVTEVLRGAASVGAKVEQIMLNTLRISPCQGCDVCKQRGRCRIEDDMQPLYDKILEADAIVLGTPIYFWGPSAQLKAFLDRWYAIDQEGLREKLAGKRLQLVCAFADEDPETASGAVFTARKGAEWFDMVFPQPLLVTASERGEVAQKHDALQQAFQTGVALGQ